MRRDLHLELLGAESDEPTANGGSLSGSGRSGLDRPGSPKRPNRLRTLAVGLLATGLALAGSSAAGGELLPALSRPVPAAAPVGPGGRALPTSSPELDFLGTATSSDPVAALGEQTVRLLFALREPATLDQVLNRGVPFDSRRVMELVEWGLLERSGTRFQTTLPLLIDEEAEAFREQLQAHVPLIVEALLPPLQALSETFDAEIGRAAFPAVVTWILRERAWHYLVEDGEVPIVSVTRSQQATYPERGWWGVFWHIEPPTPRAHEMVSIRARDRILKLVWPPGQRPAAFAGNRGRALAAQFLAFIEGDGRRVEDVDAFAELIPLGILTPDGTLRARMREWKPRDDEGVARAVESTARIVAREMTPSLSATNFATGWGDPLALAPLVYMELVPEILAGLHREGMEVLLYAPEAAATDSSTAAGREPGGSAGAPRISLVAWDEFSDYELVFPLPW